MITVGIVGGVASGKSVVAKQLAQLGATVIDADGLGHKVLSQPDVIAAAKDRWGAEVIDDEGQIVRSAVAQRVFGDLENAAEELAYWESQTHPRITALLKSKLQALNEQDANSVAVLDAAVMFKAGWDKLCDHLIFVDVPREIRIQRAAERSQWTARDFESRESSQMSLTEKRQRATFVIDNSGTLDKTYAQVLRFWNSLST